MCTFKLIDELQDAGQDGAVVIARRCDTPVRQHTIRSVKDDGGYLGAAKVNADARPFRHHVTTSAPIWSWVSAQLSARKDT